MFLISLFSFFSHVRTSGLLFPSFPLSTPSCSFHIPGMTSEMLDIAKENRRGDQAFIGVSMESAINYPLLADGDFLSNFDLLATLAPPEEEEDHDEKLEGEHSSPTRINGQRPVTPKRIWYPYYDDMFRRCWEAEGNPAATAAATTTKSATTSPPPSLHPFHLRESAIAYVNSNCETTTDRDKLVKTMADVLEPRGVPLHSFGRCLNNMPIAASKFDTLRRYKFCVAIENSEDEHYVTEKVYDAFVAGCVPIYFGALNVLEYVPHADAIIDVRALGGARRAADEIARLAADDKAYAAKHVWRDRPETWSDGFKRLQAQTWKDGVGPFERCDTTAGLSDPHMRRQCAICRAVATWRGEKEKKKR